METLLPTCPSCQSDQRQTRAGRTAFGSQRYLCVACQRSYSPVPQDQGYAPEIRHLAIKLYLEGNSLRGIARLLSCHHQTVANWVNAYQTALQEQTPDLPRPDTLETVELDELYTFIGSKKAVSIS